MSAAEIKAFKQVFEAKPSSEDLEERLKDRNAQHLFQDLKLQCDMYSLNLAQEEANRKKFPELKGTYSPTLDVHDVSKKAHYFRNALIRLARLENDDITMGELKHADPALYYRACFELYTAVHNEKKPFKFLKF